MLHIKKWISPTAGPSDVEQAFLDIHWLPTDEWNAAARAILIAFNETYPLAELEANIANGINNHRRKGLCQHMTKSN